MATKTRLEPPDGGWGILVCCGMALMFMSGLSGLPSFGLLFADFLKKIGSGTSEITIVTSVCFCTISFAGLFSGSLFKRFGLRPVAMFGACLYVLGSLTQIFVNSVLMIIINFGVLQAGGFGLMIPACFTTFNNYFVKNRILWMSFTQCLIGLGSVGFPVFLHKLLDWYGFRGCLIVLAGINAHVLLAMLLMHPVKWHMRRVEVEEPEEEKEFITPEQTKTEEIHEHESHHNSNLQHDIHKHLKISTDDLKTSQGHEFHKNPHIHREDIKLRHLHDLQKHSKFSREDLKVRSSRSSSIISLGNWTGPVVVSDASPEMIIRSRTHSIAASSIKSGTAAAKLEEPKLSFWQKTVEFLDLGLLKSFTYNNIVLGISFVAYADVTFFTLQPIYLFELNFSKSDTATIVAIGAAADLASRLFLALTALFIQMPPRYIYLAGAFFTILARFAFIYVFDFLGVACATAALGFFRTWIHVPVPLIFAEYLPKERFASGYGLYMFLHSIFIFAIGPFVGYLRDATKNYALVFHVLNSFMALCVIPWSIEIICVKFRRKGKISTNL